MPGAHILWSTYSTEVAHDFLPFYYFKLGKKVKAQLLFREHVYYRSIGVTSFYSQAKYTNKFHCT